METEWYQRRWFDYLLYFVLCVMFIDIMIVMLGPIAMAPVSIKAAIANTIMGMYQARGENTATSKTECNNTGRTSAAHRQYRGFWAFCHNE